MCGRTPLAVVLDNSPRYRRTIHSHHRRFSVDFPAGLAEKIKARGVDWVIKSSCDERPTTRASSEAKSKEEVLSHVMGEGQESDATDRRGTL